MEKVDKETSTTAQQAHAVCSVSYPKENLIMESFDNRERERAVTNITINSNVNGKGETVEFMKCNSIEVTVTNGKISYNPSPSLSHISPTLSNNSAEEPNVSLPPLGHDPVATPGPFNEPNTSDSPTLANYAHQLANTLARLPVAQPEHSDGPPNPAINQQHPNLIQVEQAMDPIQSPATLLVESSPIQAADGVPNISLVVDLPSLPCIPLSTSRPNRYLFRS